MIKATNVQRRGESTHLFLKKNSYSIPHPEGPIARFDMAVKRSLSGLNNISSNKYMTLFTRRKRACAAMRFMQAKINMYSSKNGRR